MNQTLHHDSLSDVPWPTSDERMRVPDTSMLPGSEKAPAAARQLGESVSAAEEALHAKTDPLRETRDAWAEGVRSAVRNNPLAAVATALALGVVIARVISR